MQMSQHNLFFGQPDSHILPGNTNVPQPSSFADFRFTTIGQQPELLKRISAPQPDHNYHDISSPEPSVDHDNSIQFTPKALSRPSLLETLAAQTDVEYAAADDMVLDTHFSTARLDPTPHFIKPSSSGSPKPAEGASSPTSSSQLHSHQTLVSDPTAPHQHQRTAEKSDHADASSAQVDVIMTPVHTIATSPTQEVASSPNSLAANPITASTSISLSPHQHGSAYTALRALQTRLLSSLSSFKPPQMDTSHALLLVQDANSQSANAFATAHQVHTLTQQALTIIHDAASLSQECISAAEQAKAHASAAVSTLEQLTNPGSGYRLNNEWALTEAHDALRGIGQWASEQEGEEAAQRRVKEKSEKERRHKELVDSAMRINDGSLPRQVVRAMSGEAAQRASAADTQARSSTASVQTRGFNDSHSSVTSRAAAEMEADAARTAWSLQQRSANISANISITSSLPAVDDHRNTEEKRRALIGGHVGLREEPQAQSEKQQEQQQQELEKDEAESRRVQDLDRQKLHAAQSHIKERERQERLQQEAARRAAETDELKKEAGLLEEQRRKARSMEATKAAGLRARSEKARADKQARLEKQKLEEAAKEQERRESAVSEQARLEQQEQKRVEENAAREAAARRAEEEAKKAAEAKAAEETAKASLAKAYKEAQASEQQKRQEIEEAGKEREQEAVEASARVRAKARAQELELQEAEEKRLLEEQERKRQEIMVNKQRATAETAAKILAERAQKEKAKNGVSMTPKSISPPVHASNGRTPSCSQSPLTHPLPLPMHHSPTAHIGNLTAKMTVAPHPGDTPKARARALSGGVRLGTTDELSLSQQSQPEPSTEPVRRPSPTLARSGALGLREKTPPISKRGPRSNAQISAPSQVENNIPPAKRSKTQPSAEVQSAPGKPPSQVCSDITLPPGRQSARLPATDECYESTTTTPAIPKLAISGGQEPSHSNQHYVLDAAPESVSAYRRQDAGNLRVIPEYKVSHASPQAQAANLRFVKDEGRILWNTYLKPDPDIEVKSEPRGGDDDFDLSNASMKKGSGSTSPVIPKWCLEKDPSVEADSLAAPSAVVPASALPASTTSSFTACRPNLAALHDSALKPHAPKRITLNSTSSPAVRTPNTTTAAPTTQKPKLPNFKKHKSKKTNNGQPAPSNASTSPTNSQFGLGNEFQTPFPQMSAQSPPATTPSVMSGSSVHFESQAHNNNPSLLFDDSSTIAPVIQGDDGWDTYNKTPPGFGSSSISFDRGLGGSSSTRVDVEPRKAPIFRRGRGDHYSPPNFYHPLQDERSFSGPRPARPNNQTNIDLPRDRTPIHWSLSPPVEHLPLLGKRRNRDDDSLQRQQPTRRQRQSDPQLDLNRPPPERRPPTPDRTAILQSRIGQRETGYGGDSYRPVYTSDYGPDYYAPPVQPRGYNSHPPLSTNAAYVPQSGSVVSHRDRHINLGRHQVNESRPDLIDRMGAGSNTSNYPSSHRGRPANPMNGASRGRRGRGGGGGARPLEQRISNTYNNNNNNPFNLSLARRLESPPHS